MPVRSWGYFENKKLGFILCDAEAGGSSSHYPNLCNLLIFIVLAKTAAPMKSMTYKDVGNAMGLAGALFIVGFVFEN